MAKSPVSILFSTDGVEVGLKNATTFPTDARGFVGVGMDGTTARFIVVDTTGRQVVVGAGTAGTPTGGVLSIQGVAGGVVVPISVATLPLPSGAATETTLGTRASEATLLLVQAKTDNLDVALSTRATEATLALIKAKTDNLDVGLSTRATETTLGTRLAEATFTARINTLGQKAMAASTPVVLASDQTVIPVSQSGTWTVQQGTPPWSVTVPAPLTTTGGGTEATALRVTIASDSTGLLSVDDNGGSLTVDTPQLPAALVGGRLDGNVGAWLGATTPTVGQKTMVASLPVVLASDQTSINVKLNSSTGTVTQVASSATNVTLLASNAARRGATISNDSNKTLFVKLGATASATSYTKKLGTDEYWEIPFGYTGGIDGIWDLANGNAYVTELT